MRDRINISREFNPYIFNNVNRTRQYASLLANLHYTRFILTISNRYNKMYTVSYLCDISQSRMRSDVKGLLLSLTHEIKISEIHAQLRLCRNRESEMFERICARVLKTR